MPDDDWSEFARVCAAGIPVMICHMGRGPQVMDRVAAARPDIVNIDDIFLQRRRLQATGLAR